MQTLWKSVIFRVIKGHLSNWVFYGNRIRRKRILYLNSTGSDWIIPFEALENNLDFETNKTLLTGSSSHSLREKSQGSPLRHQVVGQANLTRLYFFVEITENIIYFTINVKLMLYRMLKIRQKRFLVGSD